MEEAQGLVKKFSNDIASLPGLTMLVCKLILAVVEMALEWFLANKLCWNADQIEHLNLGLSNAVDFDSVKLFGFQFDFLLVSKLIWT